jgi:TolB-like protein
MGSGLLLLAGGTVDPTSVLLIDEGRATVVPPTLDAPSPVDAGTTALVVTGRGFHPFSECSTGDTRNSPTNLPLFTISRPDGSGLTPLTTQSWSDTQAAVALPANLPAGVYWLRVSVSAAMSFARVLNVGVATSAMPDAGSGGGAGGGVGQGGGGGGGGEQGGGTAVGGGEATGGGTQAAGGGAQASGGGSYDGGSGGGTDAPQLYSCGCGTSGGFASLLPLALLLLRRRLMGLVLVLFTAGVAQAQPVSIAMLPLKAGPQVSQGLADVITESLSAAIQKRPGVSVLTQKDITSRLQLERQRTLLGCADDSCSAEIAAALGVDRIITGSLARIGASYVFNVQMVDAHQSSTQRFSERAASASEEAFLDLIPRAVDSFFPPAQRSGAAQPAAAETQGSAAQEHEPGRFGLTVRGQAAPQLPFRGAIVAHVDVSLASFVSLGAGALIARPFGAFLRATFVPFNSDGRVRPILALETPLFFSSPISFGLSAVPGVDIRIVKYLSVGAEIPVVYFFTPDNVQHLWVFGAVTLTGHI